MREKRSVGHRLFDAPQAVLYGAGTAVAGSVTTAGAVGTLACLIALPVGGVSVIPGILCLGITYAGAGATTYFGSKTIHKASHVAGGNKDCHSLSHAGAVMSFGK